jgi:bifunctional pyridoxal-dependent enzyme with beta-cystathionase and maltose regulon repressor activities
MSCHSGLLRLISGHQKPSSKHFPIALPKVYLAILLQLDMLLPPGAAWEYPQLAEVIVARLAARYNWHIQPEDIVYLPGVVAGFNVACKIAGDIGDEVVMHAPCYGPIQKGPVNQGRKGTYALLREGTDAQGLRTYIHDHDALQSVSQPEISHVLIV